MDTKSKKQIDFAKQAEINESNRKDKYLKQLFKSSKQNTGASSGVEYSRSTYDQHDFDQIQPKILLTNNDLNKISDMQLQMLKSGDVQNLNFQTGDSSQPQTPSNEIGNKTNALRLVHQRLAHLQKRNDAFLQQLKPKEATFFSMKLSPQNRSSQIPPQNESFKMHHLMGSLAKENKFSSQKTRQTNLQDPSTAYDQSIYSTSKFKKQQIKNISGSPSSLLQLLRASAPNQKRKTQQTTFERQSMDFTGDKSTALISESLKKQRNRNQNVNKSYDFSSLHKMKNLSLIQNQILPDKRDSNILQESLPSIRQLSKKQVPNVINQSRKGHSILSSNHYKYNRIREGGWGKDEQYERGSRLSKLSQNYDKKQRNESICSTPIQDYAEFENLKVIQSFQKQKKRTKVHIGRSQGRFNLDSTEETKNKSRSSREESLELLKHNMTQDNTLHNTKILPEIINAPEFSVTSSPNQIIDKNLRSVQYQKTQQQYKPIELVNEPFLSSKHSKEKFQADKSIMIANSSLTVNDVEKNLNTSKSTLKNLNLHPQVTLRSNSQFMNKATTSFQSIKNEIDEFNQYMRKDSSVNRQYRSTMLQNDKDFIVVGSQRISKKKDKKMKINKIFDLKDMVQVPNTQQQESVQANLKLREAIQKNIREIQKKIKEKKKEVQQQKEENSIIIETLKKQIDNTQKLKHMSYSTLENMKNMNNEQSQEMSQISQGIQYSSYSKANENYSYENRMQSNPIVIFDLYKNLFENDLNDRKNNISEDIKKIQDTHRYANNECLFLQNENQYLKNQIKRYQELIENLKNPDNKEQGLEPRYLSPDKKDKESFISRGKMDSELFKYKAENLYAQSNQRTTVKSSNNVSKDNTPIKQRNQMNIESDYEQKSQFGRSNFSFQSKKPMFQNSTIDFKKLEAINQYNASIFKQFKTLNAIETLMLYIQSLKNTFRQAKVCMLLADPNLQDNFFALSKVRPNIYKKQNYGKNSLIAIFDTDEDLVWPKFVNFRELYKPLTTPGNVRVPIFKNHRQSELLMILQVVFPVSQGAVSNNKSPQRKRKGLVHRKSVKREQKNENPSTQDLDDGSRTPTSHRSQIMSKSLVSGGASNLEVSLINMFCIMIGLTVQFFMNKIQNVRNSDVSKQMVQFAQKAMRANSFRDVVKVVQGSLPKIIGFEHCQVFFKIDMNDHKGVLFTLTNSEGVDNSKTTEQKTVVSPEIAEFANNLYFPADEVIIFPDNLGITSQVHQKASFAVDNKQEDPPEREITQKNTSDFNTEINSQFSNYNLTRQISQKINNHGMKLQSILSNKKGIKGRLALQQIIESNDAENDETQRENIVIKTPSEMQLPPQNLLSKNSLNKAQAESLYNLQQQKDQIGQNNNEYTQIQDTNDYTNFPGSPHYSSQDERNNQNTKPDEIIKIDGLLNSNEKVNPSFIQLHQMSPNTDQNAIKGQFKMNLNFGIQQTKESSQSSTLVGLIKNSKQQTYYSSSQLKGSNQGVKIGKFEEVIDNFISLPQIRNYCIFSTNDDGYNFGGQSVGVLQCYNKKTNKKIDKFDLKRIQEISKLIGSLSVKVKEQMVYYTLLIGILRAFDNPDHQLRLDQCRDF